MATLRTSIGNYPWTEPVKRGTVTATGFTIEPVEVTPTHRAFRMMANEVAFDVSEMAVVTHLLAKDAGRDLVLLPILLMRQPELPLLVCPTGSPLRTVADLAGATIGVRSYTQTTAAWIRGILRDQGGVDPDGWRWRTVDSAHVDTFTDPANASRLPPGTNLLEALARGDIDAAVIAAGARGASGIRPVLADGDRIEALWSEQTGIPVNHLLCARGDLVRARPSLVEELVELFARARVAAGDAGTDPAAERDNVSAAVGALARFAHEQGITRRRYSAEELFA